MFYLFSLVLQDNEDRAKDVESNGSGEKEQLPGKLQQFTENSYLKKGAFFSLHKFYEKLNRIHV